MLEASGGAPTTCCCACAVAPHARANAEKYNANLTRQDMLSAPTVQDQSSLAGRDVSTPEYILRKHSLDMQPFGCLLCLPMDEVFKALADASRRSLLDRLHTRNGQTLNELCDGLAMTQHAVTKHLVILDEAKLVTTLRAGHQHLHSTN